MRTAGAVRAAMVGRGLPPATVALTRRGYTVQQAAQRAALSARLPGSGAAPDAGVWFLTETARPDALLAACDLAVAPAETEPGAGRFIADALRSGVPVVAHRHAPGAALLAPGAGMRSPGARASGTGRAGVFVDSDTPDAWLRALTTALDERWLREARAHAARAAESLAMDALAARIEALLVHPRSTAPAPAGPATRPGSAGPSPTRAASDQKPSQAPRR
jgi:glycosyltransferase involved in cell wall biosynthesis